MRETSDKIKAIHKELDDFRVKNDRRIDKVITQFETAFRKVLETWLPCGPHWSKVEDKIAKCPGKDRSKQMAAYQQSLISINIEWTITRPESPGFEDYPCIILKVSFHEIYAHPRIEIAKLLALFDDTPNIWVDFQSEVHGAPAKISVVGTYKDQFMHVHIYLTNHQSKDETKEQKREWRLLEQAK